MGYGKKVCVILIATLCLFTYVLAETVTENDITITSDKDTYNCLPIFNEKGECLIKAHITVQYKRPKPTPITIKSSFSTDVVKTDYLQKQIYNEKEVLTDGKIDPKKIEQTKVTEAIMATKDSYTTEKIQIKTDDILQYDMEFWVAENGKFNIEIEDIAVKTILDPIYNITVDPTNPSYHLVGGNIRDNQSINNYASATIITSGISDNSPSTRYKTGIINTSQLIYYFPFNDYNQNIARDASKKGNSLYLQPSTSIAQYFDFYALKLIQNVGSSARRVISDTSMEINNTDFTFGVVFYYNSSLAFSKYLVYHYDTVGYYIYMTTANILQWGMRDSLGAISTLTASTILINDSQPHTAIIRRNVTTGQIQMWVDGKNAVNGSGIFGGLTNYGDYIVGGSSNATAWTGWVDELFAVSYYMSDAQIQIYNTTKRLYNPIEGESIQVFFNYSMNTSKQFSLKINLYSPEVIPIRIYSMINLTHINITNYLDTVLASSTTYVPINTIIYDGYNLPLRISTLEDKFEIEDIYLYEVGNDSQPPLISHCSVNDSFVDCDDDVSWRCHVSDDSYVATAFGRVRIVGTNHTITQEAFQNGDSTLWSVDLSSAQVQALFDALNWSYLSYLNISLDYVNATDVAGNTAENTSFNVWNIYGCILCFPTWVAQYTACNISDQQIKSYTDTNNCNSTFMLPADNGTTTSCDYCTQDLQKQYTTNCYLLNNSGNREYNWIDNNFYSCCGVTGIYTDCYILFDPYNLTDNLEGCNYLINEFDVIYDFNCDMGFGFDKCYWNINLNRTNTTFNCISYVLTNESNLIQSNPVYTKKTDAVINLKNANYEDRTYFTIQNGIGSVYFTKENLIFDGRTYIFGVSCADNNEVLTSERAILVGYENINSPLTRYAWFPTQGLVIGFLIVLLMFLMFFIWMVRK